MNSKDLLNRFEILFPGNDSLVNLRRAYVDRDLHSIFRLITEPHNVENIRKFVLEDNQWSMFKLLEIYVQTQFVPAFKSFLVSSTEIDNDCFSQGQLLSKKWLVDELRKLNLDLGTIFICAGWYATLATMLFESGIKIDKIRSFDIDPSCFSIAEVFNKPWTMDEWKFKSSTKDILDINYECDTYVVTRSDGSVCELSDAPSSIINTSCEHLENFTNWYNKIPAGKLVVLQNNDFFDVDEHVNCVSSLDEFITQTPMTTVLYEGTLPLEKYNRFMRIGIK